jgi:Ras GTPase-activating-like protein IQGAP2/3/Ras GTPase-activating-like protein IQGAP1
LKVLEEEGIVTKENGYQGIITSVAKDICNRNKYRQIQIKVGSVKNILNM